MTSSSESSRPVSQAGDLAVGEILYEKYEIKALVGRGGMGTVYRVRDWDWNVDLAVKVPSHALISDWVAKERFILEAQTWIELGVHPNIVQCWFVREHEGLPLVFMDYLPHGSLKEYRKGGQVRPGDWERILDLVIQACAGLGYAHEQGLVHRDVKPANLMMRDGQLCVTDFGLVKLTQLDETSTDKPDWQKLIREMEARHGEESLLSGLTLTGSGMLLGTPEYGAPEQWHGTAKVGKQADIYALGGILYELCAGRRPFDDGVKKASPAMMLGDHLMTPPPDPRRFYADIPAALVELALQCLAKQPDDRPGSMLEMRERLEKLYRDLLGKPYPRPAPRAGTQRADALNNKAVSLWNLGFGQKAFDAWREASKLDGLHPETVYNRSMIQWSQGQIDDGELLSKLNQIKSAAPHLGTYLAYYHLHRGSPQEAEAELKQALEHPLAARHGTAWRALGDARMYQERYGEAAEAYTQALQRMPDDREARSRLDMAQQQQRQRERVLFPRAQPRLNLERRGPIASLALSTDGTLAVHWCEHSLEAWNTADGSTAWVWHDESGGSAPVRLVIEGDWVLSLDSPHGRCWSRATGQLLVELHDRKRFLATHQSWALVGGETLEQVELPGRAVLQRLSGHSKSISCAAISRDGGVAITGSGDRTVRVWDLRAGSCLQVLEGHSDLVESVALTPDGSTVLSGGRDKTVRVWHVATGDCLFVLHHGQDVRRIRISSDGRFAAVGSWNLGEKDQLDVWEVATGQRLFSRPGGHWLSLFQSGPWALSASKVIRPGVLSLWELPSGRLLRSFAEHPAEVSAFALSRDERWALTGSSDGSLRLWEVDWAARVGQFSLVVNRTSDHGQLESTHELFQQHIDRARQQYMAGDAATALKSLAEARAVPGYTRDPGALLLNSRLMQRFARQSLRSVWQLRSFSSSGPVSGVCLSSDGAHALSASGKVLYLWELASGSCVRGFTGHADQIKGLALDGQMAVSVSSDGTVRRWNLDSGECLSVVKLETPLLAVSVARGLVLAAGKHTLFGLSGEERVFTCATAGIQCLAASSDGRVAVSGAEGPDTLVLWKSPPGAAWRETRPWRADPGAGARSATAVAVSSDGRYVVCGDLHGYLRIFDLEDGSCKAHWAAHDQAVAGLCLSQDARVAVSAGLDGGLAIWEVATGRCYDRLSGASEPFLALSEEGRFLLSSGSDRVLRLWELDWELNVSQEARSLSESWKKAGVLERLGLSGFFRRRS